MSLFGMISNSFGHARKALVRDDAILANFLALASMARTRHVSAAIRLMDGLYDE